MPFEFQIEDVFSITGRGTVVVGRVLSGEISVNDIARVPLVDGTLRATRITGIEAFRRVQDSVKAGEQAGLLLERIEKSLIQEDGVLRSEDVAEKTQSLETVKLSLSGSDAPLMLLPLRIETAANEKGLRIRVFPDAMHGDTRRSGFSPDELAAGAEWRSARGSAARADLRREMEQRFGGPRAYAIRKAAEAGALTPGSPDQPRPVARDLPERLVFHVRQPDGASFTVAGEPIPRDLPMGPGPGDTGLMDDPRDPLFWLADFDRAQAVGMAAEIALDDALAADAVADVTVFGTGDGDLAGLLERLAEGAGLSALHPGQLTKGSSAAQGGPFQEIKTSGPDALAALAGTDVPDTLGAARTPDRITQAVITVLWEAALRPGFVADQVFGEDAGLDDSVQSLATIRQSLSELLPPPGELPILQVGRTPVGLMRLSAAPAEEAPEWLGRITDAIRAGLKPLAAAATQARPDPDGGADSLVETLARMPLGHAWRSRLRWHGPTLTPVILGALQANQTGVQNSLFDTAKTLKSAQTKAETFGFTAKDVPARFAEYLGSPFTSLVCGPLVAEGAQEMPDTPWADAPLARLLEDPDHVAELLPRNAARRAEEGPEPLLRILCEDGLRSVLADLSALVQTDGIEKAVALRTRGLKEPPQQSGDTPSHRLMVDLVTRLGRPVRDIPGVRELQGRARLSDLVQLITAINVLQEAPQAALHLVLANLIDAFSTRADIWIEAEARLRLTRDRRRQVSIGAWGHVEAAPLHAADASVATYHAAPSQRLARLAGLLTRAEAGLAASGLEGVIDAAFSAGRVRAARDLLEELAAAGSFETAVSRAIVAHLRHAGFSDAVPHVAKAHPDPEGSTRFDGLHLLEHGPGSIVGLERPARDALDAAITATREAADVLGALITAEGGLALSEGRAERAAGLLNARGAGAVPPAEPEAIAPRPAGQALHFGVSVTGQASAAPDLHPALSMAPALADIAARLVGPIQGDIRLLALNGPRPVRTIALSSLPGGALALVRLADADRATLAAIGEVFALQAGLDPEEWRADADQAAEDAIWAASRVSRLLSQGRSLMAEDFDDPGAGSPAAPQPDASVLQTRITAAREGLITLKARVDALLPRLPGPNPIPDVLQPVPDVQRPGLIPDPIVPTGPVSDPNVTSALLIDLMVAGLIRSTLGQGRFALLAEALASIDARLQAAEAAPTPQATLTALLDDMPALVPLRVPAQSAVWQKPSRPDAGPTPVTLGQWLETSGRVRPRLEPLTDLVLGAQDGLWQVQWPGPVQDGQSDWIGTARISDDYHAHASVVFQGPRPQAGDVIEGLMLDQWQEVVPDRTATAALAVSASAPPARAPQVALVAPAPPDGWDASSVLATIDLAVDLAKIRSLGLTDLPAQSEAGQLYGDLGALLPVLATASDTGMWRALCDPQEETRL
ncbi:EF-Tu/IF-2/RF-3 family GTPase [uncultured Roseobacter sp.]|uniref:EF-Tu/IF-2/RF-3 family GTPase n=1 Tax=uncultured Roseobacter sp. TaxID=114847 RepID=UPI00262120EF|nr:EF-Tu/IF-2/RF-3 family GTPase [uncultured Roseobacter sp.]